MGAIKSDSFRAVVLAVDDATARLGTLGAVCGCLLALTLLMF